MARHTYTVPPLVSSWQAGLVIAGNFGGLLERKLNTSMGTFSVVLAFVFFESILSAISDTYRYSPLFFSLKQPSKRIIIPKTASKSGRIAPQIPVLQPSGHRLLEVPLSGTFRFRAFRPVVRSEVSKSGIF